MEVGTGLRLYVVVGQDRRASVATAITVGWWCGAVAVVQCGTLDLAGSLGETNLNLRSTSEPPTMQVGGHVCNYCMNILYCMDIHPAYRPHLVCE
jgi:hypothetical protein